MTNSRQDIRAYLYEAPGPRTRRRVRAFTALALLGIAALIWWIIGRFRAQGQLEAKYWSFYANAATWRFIGQGLRTTVLAALSAAAITFALGFAMLRARLNPFAPLRWLGTALTEFTRGVPTLLFIYFFMFVAPRSWGLTPFWKLAIPVAVSASGAVAEALRAGVNAVPRGQTEAALSLGLSRLKVFYRVVFPQAIRYVVPTLISELVIVLKDTAFAYVVSCDDLMQSFDVLRSNHDSLVSTYLVAAAIYILINYLLNRLAAWVARRGRRTAGAAAL